MVAHTKVLGKLRQNDHLSPGVCGQTRQQSKTQALKTGNEIKSLK